MVRPCFLVVDREHSGSISTRKLVIETAKFNVLTAYSASEAIETLTLFPHMTAAIADAGLTDMSCCDMTIKLKQIQPDLPVIIVSGPTRHECSGADHFLPSFEPAKLLELLRSIVPEHAAAIEAQNEKLSMEEGK